MNGNAQSVRGYAYHVNVLAGQAPASLSVVFCPPSLYLPIAAQMMPQNARLKLGAQNCHEEVKGAYTGEVSAAMLADAGVRYVILGHSERRAMGETDEQVARKAKAARAAGLVPVICIGETLAAYKEGKTLAELDRQLGHLTEVAGEGSLIAYEPIWAIGSGLTPKTVEISAVHSHIKSVLGSETFVLYGGSVNADNAKEILALPEVSGALIGGASLEAATMHTIIRAATGA